MTDPLRIVKIRVKNFLGIDEVGIEPGKITTIKGGNATCKTSILEAVKIALGGGSLAKLANIHAAEGDEPEVVLVLKSDTDEYRIEKKGSKTATVTKRVGDTAAFASEGEPARFLKGLYDDKMSNPIKLLTASDKDRITLFLEALPLELDVGTLWHNMGITPDDIGPVPQGLHPLQELTWIRNDVFKTRTGVNRDQKAKVGSAEQLRRNIPAVLPDGHAKEIVVLENDIGNRASAVDSGIVAAQKEREKSAIEIATKRDADIEKITHALGARVAEARAAVEAAITADSAKAQKQNDAITAAAAVQLEAATATRETAIAAQNEIRAAIETDRTRLAELRTEAEAAVKAYALHEQAKEFDTEAEQLKDKAGQLTAAIDALDAYRRGLAENLPIPGLEVDDKEIRVNDIPWAQLNTAQRIDIAVEIACLRAEGQPMPLVFLDGAEALDPKNFEEIKKRLAEKTPQAFIGRVSSGELEIA